MNNNLGLYKLNSLPSNKTNIFEKIYISLYIFILFSFINIPSDTTGVGVSLQF